MINFTVQIRKPFDCQMRQIRQIRTRLTSHDDRVHQQKVAAANGGQHHRHRRARITQVRPEPNWSGLLTIRGSW